MNKDPQPQDVLSLAVAMDSEGRYAEAETQFLAAAEFPATRQAALEALAVLYLRLQQPDRAIQVLEQLTQLHPEVAPYYYRRAELLERLGRIDESAACLQQLIDRYPGFADARLQLATLLRRAGRFDDAVAALQRMLDLRIEHPEDAYLQMALVYTARHDDALAEAMLRKALVVRPTFIPALYNLALLLEELGRRDEAITLFEKILSLDPAYTDAIVRLAYARKATRANDPVIKQARRALRRQTLDETGRENLHFALGKLLDELGGHDEAFEHFREGNRCSRGRIARYDPSRSEQYFSQLIKTFSADWLTAFPACSDAAPIFICGMFRSGSTLVEQVLASHPDMQAGGEIAYFDTQARTTLAPYPLAVRNLDTSRLQSIGSDYLAYLATTFPAQARVSNKRPDNFLHLGLIKGLYPNARIIHTTRNPLDNCLSIYFQQFDNTLDYATELADIGHYFLQYQRLMAHWRALFGDRILDIAYDDVVADAEAQTRRLLQFLDLEWHDNCREFHQLDNRVRTASVWQVRQPLYKESSGRWKNYARHLEPLRQLLG